MDRIPLRDATNLRNRVIPIWVGLVPQHAPVHALSESAHFLCFTDTQLPWMSGYNDLPPPPHPIGWV